MMNNENVKRLTIKALIIMGLWAIVIILISSITLLSSIQEGMSTSVSEALLFELLCISPWILFTPAIIWLARNYRFERRTMVRSFVYHLLLAGIVFSLHSLVQSYTVSVFYDIEFTWSYTRHDFFGFLDMRVMLYAGILLGVNIIDFQKKSREIQLNESKLKAELNEAKFQALLNQIQPEFLLKSLESVKNSLDKSEEESEEILTEFSDLLRIMLANVKRDEVTIKEDLRAFQLYLNILQKRLTQPILIERQVKEECHDVLIPSFMMLIPILENIVDSLSGNAARISKISYKAECYDQKTYLEVAVEGENIPGDHVPGIIRKVGFHKIVEKFQQKYGKDIEFKMQTETDMIHIHFVFPYIHEEVRQNETTTVAELVN